MSNEELTKNMDSLYKMANPKNLKQVIANAVQLGMNFQEQRIKEGIEIVFKTLHEKV